MISGFTAGAGTLSAACVGLNRSTRAVRSNTGWMFLTAAMVNSITGIMPWITPKATLADMPRPKIRSMTGYSVKRANDWFHHVSREAAHPKHQAERHTGHH